ncbi:MAG: DUF3160 domain-containing protein, partial [Gemmataceae bacterium]|nr:DUF3160 domain-containing protein [Gemmataceae bacterium]
LITRAWDRAKLADGRAARDVWERLYSVTAFHVGLSNDLGPQQYREALKRVGGQLGDANQLRRFQIELAKQDTEPDAAVARRAGPQRPAELLDELPPTAGFRLFGRRSTPDSYILGRLRWPEDGPAARQGQDVRGLPRGLDLMAGLRRELAALDEVDRNRNLYWSWLYALQALLPERGAGYPPFMMTPAYQNKALTMALASWAHRRQDAVLYARADVQLEMLKAARIGEPAPPRLGKREVPEIYLEPLPELYARLQALTRMTRTGLVEMKVLDGAGQERLLGLERMLERLVAVAEKELADQPLSPGERAFLDNLVDNLQRTTGRAEGRLEKLEHELAAAQELKDTKRAQAVGRALLDEGYGEQDTRSVATVHADPASGQVLQVATGTLDVGLFLYRRPGGALVLGAGPVLSYYEFKRPRDQILSGAEWRRLLETRPPDRPEWMRDYLLMPRREK